MAKMSASFAKGTNTSIKHNNRDFDEKDWKNKYHSHIDQSRESENIYLKQTPIREKYKELFGAEVEKYNSTQKRKDRKIDDYYDKVKNDKTLNLQYEFIVQIGTKDDFINGENKELANEILLEFYKDFEERNPNLKIYNAVIHNDEASPHLHINVIPVADGYTRGMKLRPAFNKAIENQGFERNGDSRQVFREWRNSEIDILEKLMNERGIDREVVGTNNIETIHEYKKVMENVRNVERELSRTELYLKDMRDIESHLDRKLDKLGDIFDIKLRVNLDSLDYVEEEKTVKVPTGEKILGFEQTRAEKQKTGNIILPKSEFERLIDAISNVETEKQQVNAYIKTDLVQENIELKGKVSENEQILSRVNYRNKILSAENEELRDEVYSLREEIKEIYHGVKSFFREHFNARELRFKLNDIVDKVKENVRGGDFERLYKQEYLERDERSL